MAGRFKYDKPRRRHFIKQWREHRGLSLDDLAARIKVTSATLSRLENMRSDYSQSLLEAVGDALDLTPQDMLTGPPVSGDSVATILESLPDPHLREAAIEILKVLQKVTAND